MKILFVGNSHTYYYGMPYQCRALLDCLGVEARVTMIAQPGESLAWHRENPATLLALRYEDWDHIILQQASHPFAGQQVLSDAVDKLLLLMPQGQPVWLYNTWCEKAKPENQASIDQAFQAVSQSSALPIIAVSNAWHAVERRDPGHELYHTDGEHAGRGGSYVTALCMARALSGQSVRGLPSTLRYGKRLLNRVSPPNADLYQTVVDEV